MKVVRWILVAVDPPTTPRYHPRPPLVPKLRLGTRMPTQLCCSRVGCDPLLIGKQMKEFRWMMIPVACIASYTFSLVPGSIVFLTAEGLICQAGRKDHEPCGVLWFPTFATWLIHFLAAFAASLVILSAYLLAPAAKSVVAWVVFGFGAVYTVQLCLPTSDWGHFIAAGVGGLTTIFLLTQRPRTARSDPSTDN